MWDKVHGEQLGSLALCARFHNSYFMSDKLSHLTKKFVGCVVRVRVITLGVSGIRCRTNWHCTTQSRNWQAKMWQHFDVNVCFFAFCPTRSFDRLAWKMCHTWLHLCISPKKQIQVFRPSASHSFKWMTKTNDHYLRESMHRITSGASRKVMIPCKFIHPSRIYGNISWWFFDRCDK